MPRRDGNSSKERRRSFLVSADDLRWWQRRKGSAAHGHQQWQLGRARALRAKAGLK
jgi:hypothetical protein